MLSGTPGWFGATVVILNDADVLSEALRGLSSFLLPHGLQPITEGPSESANHRGPFGICQSESRTAPTAQSNTAALVKTYKYRFKKHNQLKHLAIIYYFFGTVLAEFQ